MQNKQRSKAKKKIQPIKKPYLTGKPYFKGNLRASLKLLMYEALFIFLNLMLGASLSFDNSPVLCIIFNLLLVMACGALVYMDGARTGEADVAVGEIAYARQEMGKQVDQKDLERCYNPWRGILTVLVGTSVLLVLACIHAFAAQKQVYTLQSLPGWVSAYSTQQDVMQPLAYYMQQYTTGFLDILRIVIRACIFPFINIAGVDNADGVLLVDRLSPLLILLPFLCYALGYLKGPKMRAMVHGNIATGLKRRKRKEKRERKARQQNKPNQLV